MELLGDGIKVSRTYAFRILLTLNALLKLLLREWAYMMELTVDVDGGET